MPTITIFGTQGLDAGINSNNATYATALAGSNLNVQTADTIFTGQGTGFSVTEYFVQWELAANLVASDILISAVAHVFNNGDFTNGTNPEWRMRESSWGSSLDTGDFLSGGGGGALAGKTLLATFPSASLPGFADCAFVESGTALLTSVRSNLDGANQLRVVVANSRIEAGTQPTGTETAGWVAPHFGGASLDPQLIVVMNESAIMAGMREPMMSDFATSLRY